MLSSKWYLAYFFLAGFDLLAILLSLFLNYNLLRIHENTVGENQNWAERLRQISRVSQDAREINVAANNVFESGNIELSKSTINEKEIEFAVKLDALQLAIEDQLRPEQQTEFVRHLDSARSGMKSQIDKAHQMFDEFANNRMAAASEMMARMDRENATIGKALANSREEAEKIQADFFNLQTESAEAFRWMEFVLFGCVALMVIGATVYGTRLARTANEAFKIVETQSREEAKRAERMSEVAQLATGVAHELRNPLTSVKLLVQTGRKQGITGDELDVVSGQVERMERSLNSFLDYARPPRLDIQDCDLANVIQNTAQLIQARATQQSVEINIDGPTLLPMTGDTDQLLQLLLNLCQNALDEMKRGGTLTIRFGPLNETQVTIEVQDTGAGIDEQIRPKLFQPFVTSKETGVGLGLLISRQIARQHGGDLTVSRHGQSCDGASFVVTLLRSAETS